jgi:uncharacterized MAPEG superfamily protein
MSIAFWCVLIVGLLPYVTVGIAKWDKSFDNNAPRDWLAKQEGAKRRAHAAHLNTFEAFPLFAAAVIIATLCHAPRVAVDGLAVVFVVARVLYIWFYITDRASLRSVVWIAGLGISVALFVLAALGA